MTDKKTINKDNNTIGEVPKGIGVSPKVFMTIIGILFVVFILVIMMIFTYRSKKSDITPAEQNKSLVQQQTSITPEAAIKSINQETSNGVLVSQKQQSISKDQTPLDTADESALKNFSEAAQSNISIINTYHGPTQQASGDQATSANQQVPSNLSHGLGGTLGNMGSLGKGENFQQQNMQTEKTAFLKNSQKANDNFYLDSKVTKPKSPFEVKAGTIIPATLLTGINSDLPGQVTAQVSQNVYDTVTGNYLLIPQGTKVIGAYDNQVAYGQERVLMAWSRLIFPNGDSFDLEGQPGADLAGMAGLHDLVNNHYVRIFGSALMFSLFGALGQLSQPQQANNVLSSQAIIYGAVGQQMSQTGAQLVEKNINLQPTNQIRPGANFNILLTRDMVLPGPYKY
jgi:type IV secretory pathway VirB10-like protein